MDDNVGTRKHQTTAATALATQTSNPTIIKEQRMMANIDDEDDNNLFDVEEDNSDDCGMVKYIEKLKRKVHEMEQNRERNVRSNNNRTNGSKFSDFNLTQNERLWRMKNQEQLIDAAIITMDGYRETIHMDMLLLLDPNIDKAFKFAKELTPNIKEYQMESSVSGDVIREVISFAYKKHIDFNDKNCLEIADFASKYGIVPIVKHCMDYLLKNLTIQNALRGYELSTKFIIDKSLPFKTFIEDHFDVVCAKMKNELVKMDHSMMIDLLTSSKLNIAKEEIVWSVICDWIEYDTINRLQYLKNFLFQVLRFGRLHTQFFHQQVLGSEWFQRLPLDTQLEYENFVQEKNLKTVKLEDGFGLYLSEQSIFFQPRDTKEMLLVAGGWVEGQTTNSWEIYDYQTNLWLSVNVKLDRKISYFGLELIDDTIYVFGGSNGREIYSTLQALNLNSPHPRWLTKCSMIESRCYVSSAVLNGRIYAIGGFNQRHRMRKCERYDPRLDNWQEITDLNYARSDASCVVHQGKIFIAGGINDSCIERSVEVYNPELNRWQLIRSMNTPRTSFAIASFQNKIWALGGNDGVRRSDTVECYDPETDEWTEMSKMLIKRSTFRATVLRNELYVIGGYNGQSPICNVEKYVPDKGWIKMKEMRHDRSGLSLICIPNNYYLIKI